MTEETPASYRTLSLSVLSAHGHATNRHGKHFPEMWLFLCVLLHKRRKLEGAVVDLAVLTTMSVVGRFLPQIF